MKVWQVYFLLLSVGFYGIAASVDMHQEFMDFVQGYIIHVQKGDLQEFTYEALRAEFLRLPYQDEESPVRMLYACKSQFLLCYGGASIACLQHYLEGLKKKCFQDIVWEFGV